MPGSLVKSSIAVFIGASMSVMPNTFLEDQLKFERVSAAYHEKEQTLKTALAAHDISMEKLNLLIVAYKDSDELEVYGKNTGALNFAKIISYPICARSGTLGPKSRKGDGQVPEGFYYIDRFNPKSNFHLSLGINYPNLSDQRRNGTTHDLGGDIFIHGSCATIGCLPMTDNAIKEIYVLAAHARNNGQSKIPVYIFPFRMTPTNMQQYKLQYKGDKTLTEFWDNLGKGYEKFVHHNQALTFQVNDDGRYAIE